jgi:hypothetical protein
MTVLPNKRGMELANEKETRTKKSHSKKTRTDASR